MSVAWHACRGASLHRKVSLTAHLVHLASTKMLQHRHRAQLVRHLRQAKRAGLGVSAPTERSLSKAVFAKILGNCATIVRSRRGAAKIILALAVGQNAVAFGALQTHLEAAAPIALSARR